MSVKLYVVFPSHFAVHIVYRRNKPFEFLGFVWTGYLDYVITSATNTASKPCKLKPCKQLPRKQNGKNAQKMTQHVMWGQDRDQEGPRFLEYRDWVQRG